MATVSSLGPTYDVAEGPLYATCATAIDYSAVEHFLCDELCRVRTADFFDQLESPEDNAPLRLLLKQDNRIVGHVPLQFHDIRWGKSRLSTCRFGTLDLLPKYRNISVVTTLLREIELVARRRKTVLIRADLADISRAVSFPGWPSDWLASTRFDRLEASPRSILAELAIQADRASTLRRLEYSKSCKAIRIRPFRQVELLDLMKVYRVHENTGYGFVQRSESYWRRLVCQSADAQIFVAVDHTQSCRTKQRGGRIVAYAVVDGNEILEIVGESENSLATKQLLTRICADAIEQNCRVIRLHTASRSDRFTEIFAAAGWGRAKSQSLCAEIVRVPSLKLLVRRLSSEFLRRWQSTSTAAVDRLGWGAGERACQLVISDKGVRLLEADAGVDHLICSYQIWVRLLMGELTAPAAFSENLLEASTPLARQLAEILFPEIPTRRPVWDNSLAI